MGGVLIFSQQYLKELRDRTGFRPGSLERQMTLLHFLREIGRHPFLKSRLALKGGTAINMFWFELPRLSVDIDLNYIGSADRETMLKERPVLEAELKKLIQAAGGSIQHAPTDHAGGKWRLKLPSALEESLRLEIDVNYILRIPVWGISMRTPCPLDEDYVFDFPTVSFEELFAGKITALLDRAAARDLYDVAALAENRINYDRNKLRQTLILFGITADDDWRRKDFSAIDRIDQHQFDQELSALLREGGASKLAAMKQSARVFLSALMRYDDRERQFMDRFVDHGEYAPELLFDDAAQAQRLKHHPAVLWKLQNHRKFLGLEK